MNNYVFAAPDAPFKNIKIGIEGSEMTQSGTLKKGVPVPFSIRAAVSATADGKIRLHPTSIRAAGFVSKRVLDFFGLELDNLVKMKNVSAVVVDGDDLLLDPQQLLPPPQIRGRLTRVVIENGEIVQQFGAGSSKGIADDAVVRDARALAEVLPQALRAYPNGVLVEEFVAGTDVTVPFLEGRGDEGVLLPVDYLVDPSARSRFNLYDYRLKSADASKVSVRCPPDLPRDVVSRLRAISKQAARALGMRDLGRIDFRVGEDGRLYLLEVNALPSLEPGASLYAAAAREGLDFGETLHAVVESAARRQGLVVKPGARRRRPADPLRIGFTFNVKRVDPKGGNDAEAEYDAPETIDAIREALEHYGHVTLFEADAELPRHLMQTPVDLVFNIAEGVAGRNREAAVPALCELMGIPYTGSDAATLSIALDKALSKRVLLQHEILTAEFQVMETGRERLSSKLKFPLIVKPNQEGSSKCVSASASVCDNEESLRAIVRELIDRYRQPALGRPSPRELQFAAPADDRRSPTDRDDDGLRRGEPGTSRRHEAVGVPLGRRHHRAAGADR
jgi:D-alanine-D-alanine ligase-like ATP-grasp enzyme